MARWCPHLLAIAILFGSHQAAARATPPPSGPGPTPPQLRLDDRAAPVRYQARLQVDPSQTTFAGSIDIALAVKRPTNLLWLNGTELTVQSARFEVGGKKLPARVVAGGESFVGFATDEALPAGAAKLHVEYRGPISRKEDRGLFAEKEGGEDYALTQFESLFARRVFPCFDEPSFKVPWQLSIEAPEKLTVVSNTPVKEQRSEHPGLLTSRFAETAPLPSYLIAFAVGPYDLVPAGQAGKRGTPIRVAVPRGRGADARWAVKVSGQLLELLEAYFDIPYPFEKLDNVSVPLTTSFGAMENAGMVTYSQRILVAKPADEGLRFQRGYAITAAHEFAHQWFGDLVTTRWWDDIWLNESFASWMEDKIIDQWKPEWNKGVGHVEARTHALGVDLLANTRKIRQPIVTEDDIYNAFDGITYQKGQAVLTMFERFVSPETFRRGVKSYMTKHANGTATADDFVGAISAAAGRDLGSAFRSFLDQPGAPLVDVSLTCAEGKPPTLNLAQRRLLPLGSAADAQQHWQIPMCFRWVIGEKTDKLCTLVTQPEEILSLGQTPGCPTWLTANDGQAGYYSVSYPRPLLAKLLDDKGRARLDLAELTGLVDELRMLSRAGKLPFADALGLVVPLAADHRRPIANQVIDLVGSLNHHLVSDAERPNYRRFVGKLYGKEARRLGWTAKADEDEDTRLLRPQIVGLVADDGGDRALREQAKKLALAWMADRKAVAPEVAGQVLRVAAIDGDRALFDRYLAEIKKAQGDRHDRSLLIASLGDFRRPELAKAALELVLSPDHEARETSRILWSLAGENETRQLAWDFLRAHFDELLQRLSPEALGGSPRLASGFCDEAHERELDQTFGERVGKLPGGPRTLAQSKERIALCRALVAAQKSSVHDFLKAW